MHREAHRAVVALGVPVALDVRAMHPGMVAHPDRPGGHRTVQAPAAPMVAIPVEATVAVERVTVEEAAKTREA